MHHGRDAGHVAQPGGLQTLRGVQAGADGSTVRQRDEGEGLCGKAWGGLWSGRNGARSRIEGPSGDVGSPEPQGPMLQGGRLEPGEAGGLHDGL